MSITFLHARPPWEPRIAVRSGLEDAEDPNSYRVPLTEVVAP
jgi:hypothetical protein